MNLLVVSCFSRLDSASFQRLSMHCDPEFSIEQKGKPGEALISLYDSKSVDFSEEYQKRPQIVEQIGG